ncbi:hypothetical protein AAFF_G00251150 [Aldrovandia affinis]|uniref:Uncharacterized protein n=1 Tax=Aldrovandia affinis TaxID=143900 RepID=A0AAD7W372_9TELE|nr:hypothetical protein AAFF_G00251150 [Aldrovandia affinis]
MMQGVPRCTHSEDWTESSRKRHCSPQHSLLGRNRLQTIKLRNVLKEGLVKKISMDRILLQEVTSRPGILTGCGKDQELLHWEAETAGVLSGVGLWHV